MDALKAVTAHLSFNDRKALHATCRSLRSSPAVLAAVTCAWGPHEPPVTNFTIVSLMPSLRVLRISACACLAQVVPHLACLARLTQVALHQYTPATPGSLVNLAPLSCLTRLALLQLYAVTAHTQLASLTSLRRLELETASSTWGVSALTGLQALELSNTADLHCLSALHQLTRLRWATRGVAAWELAVLEAACGVLQELAGLHILEIGLNKGWNLAAAVQQLCRLRQLTALQFNISRLVLASCVDFSMLPLKRLGLTCFGGTFKLLAPSVTHLYLLSFMHRAERLLDLTACSSLRQLRLGNSCTVTAEILPRHNIKLPVWCLLHPSMLVAPALLVQPDTRVQLQLIEHSVDFMEEL